MTKKGTKNKSSNKADDNIETHSVYSISPPDPDNEKHTISVLVDNEFGVLARVIGLFSARGYNLESLTVSEVDHTKNLSRITLITKGSERVITQIMAQLDRLIPVYEVRDLTVEGPHIEREVALVKLVNESAEERFKAQQQADKFGARTVDSTPDSYIFELSDTSAKIDTFVDLLRPLGVKEICRTGVTAISRGAGFMEFRKE